MTTSAIALLALLSVQSAPLTPQAPIVVPGGPGHFDFMNVDPINRLVFACHPQRSSFTVVNLVNNEVKDVNAGVAVNGIAADPVGKKVYAAGPGNTLVKFDMNSWTKEASLPLGGPGDCVAYDAKRGVVYVDNDDGTSLWIVDATSMKLTGTVTIKEAPEVMEYDETRNRIFQNIKTTNTLQVIDPDSKSVVSEWQLGGVTGPHGLVLDKSMGRLFVAGSNGMLAILDAADGKVITTLDLKQKSDQIGYDPGLKRLYIPGSGLLATYQVTESTATLLGSTPLPKGCHSVTVDPVSHQVWIAYSDDKDSYVQSFTAQQ